MRQELARPLPVEGRTLTARVTSGALILPLNAHAGEQVSRRYVKFFNANIGMPERPPRLRDLRDRALVATLTYLFARLVLP